MLGGYYYGEGGGGREEEEAKKADPLKHKNGHIWCKELSTIERSG